jgi:hypothetical protein
MLLPFQRALPFAQTFLLVPQFVRPIRLGALLLLLGVLLGRPASAQNEKQSIQLGLTVGLNLATLDAPTSDAGVRTLLAGGVVAQTNVVGPLSAQAQLLLEQKGTLIRDEDGPIRYGATYVDLPLFLRVRGPSLGPVALYGLAGGFGGVKLFETQRAGTQGLSLPLDTNTSFFRRTNAGLVGGIGGTIWLPDSFSNPC